VDVPTNNHPSLQTALHTSVHRVSSLHGLIFALVTSNRRLAPMTVGNGSFYVSVSRFFISCHVNRDVSLTNKREGCFVEEVVDGGRW
jgi:ABC-type enterochelin transport system permease subunit